LRFFDYHFPLLQFENIMTLSAHHGEIWSLAIAKQGTFIVSGSQDRSIRTWQQTDEPVHGRIILFFMHYCGMRIYNHFVVAVLRRGARKRAGCNIR